MCFKNCYRHERYSAGHPWYYFLGGKVLTPKQIWRSIKDDDYRGYAADKNFDEFKQDCAMSTNINAQALRPITLIKLQNLDLFQLLNRILYNNKKQTTNIVGMNDPMAFDDSDLTAHEKEQKVFSDMQFDPDGGKDFKQISRRINQDELNGVDQKERDEKFDNFASMVEMAEQQFAKQREEFMHKLNGYEVSATDVRKAATNILRDYDNFADRFGLEGDDKEAVYDQMLLLQKGTPEQQEQALKDLQERDPELADAVLEEAYEQRQLDSSTTLSADHDYSADYNFAVAEPSAKVSSALKPATI